jgi:hypothetical protein
MRPTFANPPVSLRKRSSFILAVSHKVIVPWPCLVGLMDDLYTVEGNTCVTTLKLFNWV